MTKKVRRFTSVKFAETLLRCYTRGIGALVCCGQEMKLMKETDC